MTFDQYRDLFDEGIDERYLACRNDELVAEYDSILDDEAN